MKRGTTRGSSGDAALRELERALDAFMATHVATAANSLATNKPFDEDDEDVDAVPNSTDMMSFQRDLKRLQSLSSMVTTIRRRGPASVVNVARLLLSWLHTVESSSAAAAASSSTVGGVSPSSATEAARAAEQAQQQSPIDPVASWLVATLLQIAFQASLTSCSIGLSSVDRAALDELVAVVVSRCLIAFQRSWKADEDAQRRVRAESSGTLFSYLTMRKTRPKTPSSSGVPSALTVCLTCTTEAGIAWGHVLGLAACVAPDVARMKLQKEIPARAAGWDATKAPAASGDVIQHPYLKHLTHLRLGLAPSKMHPSSTLTSRMADAARWLRVVMPLLLKPHRSHVRSACAHLVSQLLVRELHSLGRLELSVLYTSTGSDWSRCISDLHAAALRLTDCAKKKSRGRAQQHLEASSWALRTVVLALAPGEIFTRYWREDALALLRLQYHLNQDAGATSYNVLPSLALSFTYLMHRHFLLRDAGATTAGAPSDSDCMEIINTTQAWGFFSLPRLRPQSTTGTGSSSFTALRTIAIPALVHVSRAIASYNMTYAVQSHLRRLLAEPVGVGDPQKLVGLEALVDLLRGSQDVQEEGHESRVSFRVNQNDLLSSKQLLGELVGRVLLECNTRLGHKLVTEIPVTTSKEQLEPYDEEDDEEHWKDPTHAVAVATFAAALALMPPLYTHVALSNDQKVSLLVRTSVNVESVVHRRAQEALVALVRPQSPHLTESPPPDAAVVVRAVTDYIMRMHATVSEAAGAILILRLLRVLLEPSRAAVTRWECSRARFEALIQVEAIAVYLLARGDDNLEAEHMLRLACLETLQVAHDARVTCWEQYTSRNTVQLPLVDRPSVWSLLDDLDPDLHIAFYTFGQDQTLSKYEKNVDKHQTLRRLIVDTSERHSFRWSLCLARIFRTLTRRAPDVIAYIWADMADKVTKLEPVLAVTPVAGDSPINQRELARWRNLALLATVSTCPMLLTHIRKTEASFSSENSSSGPSEPPSVSPSTTIASLVRQLACYLRSTNAGQRSAAILALGHTGSAALPTVLDVLGRLETEAFNVSCNGEQETNDVHTLPANVTQRSRSIKTAKLPKKKLLELQHTRIAQLTLQWAVGRCYRLLLESRTGELNDHHDLEPGGPIGERLRRVVAAFLTNIRATFEDATTCVDTSEGSLTLSSASLAENPVLLMMQLDFMSTLRSLLLYSNTTSHPVQHLPHDQLAAQLLGWCGSFDKDLTDRTLKGSLRAGFVARNAPCGLNSHWMQQCDVHAVRDGHLFFPWLWIDSQHQLLGSGGSVNETCAISRSIAQYLICHRAFSTLTEVLRSSLRDGTGTWDDDSVVTWLDTCFSVDSVTFDHFHDLQQLAQRALHALLELSPGTARFTHVVKRCLAKATCVFSSAAQSELRVARQYLEALGASREVTTFFRSLLHRLQGGESHDKDASCLAVRLVHVLLLHVGVQSDDKPVQHRQGAALNIVAALLCEPGANHDDDESAATRWGLQGYYSPSLEGLVAGRLQVTVSALLASRFAVLSLRVSLAILRSMPVNSLQTRQSITQQRQMLAAMLPWLAQVALWPTDTSNRLTELLDLMFNLTATFGDSCGEQLDHMWLTLAFGEEDANLCEIVSFLFDQQRKSQRPSETAKTIMWWLCRWQDAASDVLRLLLLQLSLLTTRERDSTEIVTALDELRALVMLASDTSCHLQSGANTNVRALAVHLVHVALATLFTVLDTDNVDESVCSSIRQHCHVLLHSVFPLLEAPRGLLAAVLSLLQASTSNVDKAQQLDKFLEALRALAACLSTTETQIWSELCVQEIASSISLETSSTHESLDSIRRPSSPHEVCIRFALVAYTQLSPRFQGDVLLSILTLLRQTLTASVYDSRDGRKSRSVALARECLALLAMLIRSMPVSRLVLYPQVFWVSLALLTHCRQQRDNSSGNSSSLHDKALEVLSIIWSRPSFTSHAVTQDVIQWTRPVQWEIKTTRNSVLMEIVRCLYTDESLDSRVRALKMMQKAVLLAPRRLLGVSIREHLVVCTLALLPALTIPSEDGTDDEVEAWEDLVVLWQTAGTSSANEQILGLLQTRPRLQTEGGSRQVAFQFMTAFVPAIYALELNVNDENSFDSLKLSLEVLVACLPLPHSSELPGKDDGNNKRCDFVFVLLEQLLQEVLRRTETMKRPWRPVPELEATLARLVRSPRSERQWKLAMRVLTWVAEMAKVAGSGGSSITPLSMAPRRSLPGQKSSELSATLGRIAETDNDLPPGTSKVDNGSTCASSMKKTPHTRALLRIMSSRSRSSGSISKNLVSDSVNNEVSTSPELLAKDVNVSEQPGNEHEDQSLSTQVEFTVAT